MNVNLPLWIVAAQWTLLLALGVFVILMYRQIGYYMRLQRLGAERLGLAIGETAQAFDFSQINSGLDTKRRFEPHGQWSLLLFADPGCAGCERALRALDAIRAHERMDQIRTLVATRADVRHLAPDDAFRTAGVAIGRIEHDDALALYRVRRTPFVYVIDPKAVIRGKGVAEDQAALRDLLEPAMRRSIPLVPIAASTPIS